MQNESQKSSDRIVLYIHGMGGGSDSRIPSILRAALESHGIEVVARTYSFDPQVAHEQISSWVEELSPSLVIGESLGSLHAIRIKGIPHILVSPALNAPLYLEALAWLSLLPGITPLFDRIYRPREGDRQPLHFTFRTLRKYLPHLRKAMENSVPAGSTDSFHACFGTHDHYRRSGIVSVRTWKKAFGESSYELYEGSHFMEEEHIHSLLVPRILRLFFPDRP